MRKGASALMPFWKSFSDLSAASRSVLRAAELRRDDNPMAAPYVPAAPMPLSASPSKSSDESFRISFLIAEWFIGRNRGDLNNFFRRQCPDQMTAASKVTVQSRGRNAELNSR